MNTHVFLKSLENEDKKNMENQRNTSLHSNDRYLRKFAVNMFRLTCLVVSIGTTMTSRTEL